MEYSFQLISSLDKVFCTGEGAYTAQQAGSMLRNERYSFQLLGNVTGGTQPRVYMQLEIDSPLSDCIRAYRVGYVPSVLPCMPACDDPDYLTKQPGLFPDPLYPVIDGKIELASNQNRAFWLTIEPQGRYSGSYPITLRIRDDSGAQVAALCFTIEIIDADLPAQTLINTGWFHCDCLAQAHGVEMMSDAHFALMEKYMRVYAAFGHNMILTPVFTPPLDTAVGAERPTMQLVDVRQTDDGYTFGFEKLERFVHMAQRCGITYFEISHLFTQWGAKCAPKIMAVTKDGYRRLFGWETDAQSPEYVAFLAAFLPQLDNCLQTLGIADHTYFHVSDEPYSSFLDSYRAAKESIAPYLKNYPVIDALSDYDFYQNGLVTKPIVSTDHVQPFLEHGVPDLWVYYCCGQDHQVANRFMAMPSYRNRILGYQLYRHNIEGFLQWGYNFWYSQFSLRAIDPYANTDADGSFQSGDAFVVYPCDEHGEVICSLRLYVFADALQDLRALQLLESKLGRPAVLEFLKGIDGFDRYPRDAQTLLLLRESINERIKAAL